MSIKKIGPLGEIPEEWEVAAIGELVTEAQYGLSVRGQEAGAYPILRMNCQINGRVVFEDLQYVDLDTRTFEKFRLKRGDVLFNRTNSYELVGRSALYDADTAAVFASYLVKLRVDDTRANSAYLNYLLNWDVVQTELKKLASRGVSQANISASKLKDFIIHLPRIDEQAEIARALDQISELLKRESTLVDLTFRMKRGLLQEFFVQRPVANLPDIWDARPLEEIAAIYSSSRLSYSELLAREETHGAEQMVEVLGIKVIDMTHSEAEVPLVNAQLVKAIGLSEAEKRCIPPNAIVFPKNGAAVATNKKRRVAAWCVLDPNVMALYAQGGMDQTYLYYWIQSFDLGSIVKPGPVPNFGKGDISGVIVPVPRRNTERDEIVALLTVLDRKIDLHRRKREVLTSLFKVTLHKLMTGEIRASELDLAAFSTAPASQVAA